MKAAEWPAGPTGAGNENLLSLTFRVNETCAARSLVITFRTKRIQKLCNDSKAATAALGPDQAKRLRRRLDDLNAAHDLAVMRSLPGRTHELSADRKGQLSIDLIHPDRLIFSPADSPPPTKPDGGLDWAAVTAIEVIDIVDTHE